MFSLASFLAIGFVKQSNVGRVVATVWRTLPVSASRNRGTGNVVRGAAALSSAALILSPRPPHGVGGFIGLKEVRRRRTFVWAPRQFSPFARSHPRLEHQPRCLIRPKLGWTRTHLPITFPLGRRVQQVGRCKAAWMRSRWLVHLNFIWRSSASSPCSSLWGVTSRVPPTGLLGEVPRSLCVSRPLSLSTCPSARAGSSSGLK